MVSGQVAGKEWIKEIGDQPWKVAFRGQKRDAR